MGDEIRIVALLVGGPRDGQEFDCSRSGFSRDIIAAHPGCSDLCGGCLAAVDHGELRSGTRSVRYRLREFDGNGRAIYRPV